MWWSLDLSINTVSGSSIASDQAHFAAAFLKRFGVETATGLQIPAAWQSGLSNGSSAGGILGLLVRHPLSLGCLFEAYQ